MKNRVQPKDQPEHEVPPGNSHDSASGEETQEMQRLSVQEIERLLKSDEPAK